MADLIPYSDIPIAPILDSRKNEFFTARFIRGRDHALIRDREDIWLRLEDLPVHFKQPVLFIGNDFASQYPILKKLLGPLAHFAPSHFWNLRASGLAGIGIKRFRAKTFDDPLALNPIYLRTPDIR